MSQTQMAVLNEKVTRHDTLLEKAVEILSEVKQNNALLQQSLTMHIDHTSEKFNVHTEAMRGYAAKQETLDRELQGLGRWKAQVVGTAIGLSLATSIIATLIIKMAT
jgi:hypothetical protein